ncbi:MAG: peptidoglycan-binding domain-containing protein [Candidatus Woesearchaeota archaeon]
MNKRKQKIKESLSDFAGRLDQDHEIQLLQIELYNLAESVIKLHDKMKTLSDGAGINDSLREKIAAAVEDINSIYEEFEDDGFDSDLKSEFNSDVSNFSDDNLIDKVENMSDFDSDTGVDFDKELTKIESEISNKRRVNEAVLKRPLKELSDYNRYIENIINKNNKPRSNKNHQLRESSALVNFAKKGSGGLANENNETQAIKELQSMLNNLGINVGEEDGLYGRQTMSGVRDFQKTVGTSQDGDAGPQTIKELIKLKNFKYSGGNYKQFFNDLVTVEEHLKNNNFQNNQTQNSNESFSNLISKLHLLENDNPEIKKLMKQLSGVKVSTLPSALGQRLSTVIKKSGTKKATKSTARGSRPVNPDHELDRNGETNNRPKTRGQLKQQRKNQNQGPQARNNGDTLAFGGKSGDVPSVK